MARIILRSALLRTPHRPARGAGLAIAGLAVGAVLGTLAAELMAPVQRAARSPRRSAAPSVAELVHDAQAVLDADVQLRDCGLEVIPVGRGSIELHGWVGDRKSRTRAAMLVAQGVDAATVINCILVRGEDDVAPPTAAEDDDALLA